MNRVELMELVREYQVGASVGDNFDPINGRLGSVVAANTLLAACTAAPNENPTPVVDESQPTAVIPDPTAVAETVASSDPVSGLVSYPGLADEPLMGYWAHQGGDTLRPAIIVIQEWWGLNDHIKDIADRFAAEGYVALAPDLYHGVVTTEPDEARKQAMELGMRDAVAEIQQAINFLKEQPLVNGRFGTIGFCMGGGLVLQTAANSPDIAAAIPFYGTPLSATAAASVTAPVLSFLGTRDGIPASGYEVMHAALSDAGIINKFQLYEGAQHAFFNDTRASYDADAAADAWQQTLAWFQTHLG